MDSTNASSLAVRAISEELGVHINDSINLNDIAKDAEFYITSILKLANRLRKHKSSKILRVNDLNDSLASCSARPLYGYKSNRIPKYESVGVLANGNEILASSDRQISLNEIASSSLERYPIDTSFTFHWLAINGVEPQIEENSCSAKVPGLISQTTNDIPEQAKFPDQRVVIINSKLMVSKELQTFYLKCLDIIKNQITSNSSGFTDKFIDLIKTLSKEAAIQPLLKFFLRHITEVISVTSRNIMHLNVALTLAKALFSNPNLENEPFIQTYTSIATTLLLSRFPFEDDFNFNINMILNTNNPQLHQKDFEKCISIDQGISIRNSAADFLGIIVQRFGKQFPDLNQRIAEFLTNIIFDTRILSISQYGAVLGLQRIDLEIVRSILIPSIDAIIIKIKNDMRNVYQNVRKLAVNLNNMLLHLCVMCYEHDLSNNMNPEEVRRIYSKVMLYYGNDFVLLTS